MSTGYTHAVQDGTITDFPTFAMQCARAFGALVAMRDDPSDAKIPQQFEPSDYNAKRLAEAHADLARLQAMTVDQQTAACKTHNDEAEAYWLHRDADRKAHRARYEAMLAKVRAWTPPTGEHIEMKSFMEKQLLDSISFDCGPSSPKPERKKRADWYAEALATAKRDIEYHAAENEKEIARARSRTAWVASLRASLVSTSK